MPIKIAPRATISDDFKLAMTAIYRAKLQQYQNQEKTLVRDPSRHSGFMRQNGQSIAGLRALLQDQGRIDMEYTRLRSLPYTKFEFVVREGYPYLYGLTKDVTLEVVAPALSVPHRRSARPVASEPEIVISTWDMGPYAVVIPVAFFGPIRLKYPDQPHTSRAFGAVQMIPMRDKLSRNRTPHHYAEMPFVDGEPVSTNPLDMVSHICWGGFSSVVLACGDQCDIVETFRNIFIYLCRYNPNSPYVQGIGSNLTEKFSFARQVS